jgi:two-component system cell cycle sensor histidine kinase/response regulator CckA
VNAAGGPPAGAVENLDAAFWTVAIDVLPEGVGVLDSSGVYIAVNESLCRLTGYSRNELVGIRPPFPHWPDDGRDTLYQALGRVLQGETVDFESTFRRKSGETFPVRLRASMVPGTNGHPPRFVTSVSDISDRKHHERELRRSEERWRSIAENPFDFVTVIDRQYKYTYVNHAAPGIRVEDLIGRATPFDFADPAYHAVMRDAFDRAFRDGVTTSYEAYSPPLGKWFGNIIGAIVEDGVVTALSVQTRDVTDTKRAADAVRNSEHRLQLALAGGDVGAFDMNIATGELYCSPHFYALLGYPTTDPKLFRTIDEFRQRIHPDDAPGAERALQEALNQGAPFDVEYRLRTVADSYRWFHGRGRSFLESDGTRHFSGFVTDVTQRKAATQERIQLEAQLRHAQKLETLGTLAGGIAHDFNNLLVPILGNAQLALRALDPSSPLRVEIEDIVRAAERARELVSRILVFGRRAEERREPVKVPTLIAEVASFLKASVPSNVQIIGRVNENCPTVMGDPNQIHQALTNVCTNAYQALGSHGGRIELIADVVDLDPGFALLHAMKPGRAVVLSVEDTGPGISAAVLERIFEPFFTTKGPGEGSGLGLAMVHAIVTRHGGTATAHSTLGAGAQFRLYFPAGPSGAEAVAPVARRVIPTAVVPRRIVCVDDEPGVLRALVRILTHAGHTVTPHTSPVEALEHIKKMPDAFDVVVTDLTMPGIRGTDLAARLFELRPNLPVVLATGYGDPGAGVLPANIRVCLEKPIDVDTLIQGITRALS